MFLYFDNNNFVTQKRKEIIMEYNEYNENDKKSKSSSAGFYAIIACCLVILGAVAWFAVSNLTRTKNPNENSSGSQENYSSNDNSSGSSNPNSSDNFVSDIIDTTPSQPTAKDESKVPYTSQESAPKAEAFILPVNGEVLKGYSDTALQYSATYGDMRLHTGIDIKCEKNTQIKSSASGTVSDIKDDSAFGKVVTIDHGNGITLSYCGLNSVSVQMGQKVSSGEIIGTIGSIPCESSDGVHLHISALVDGKIVSPLKAMGLN